MSFFTADVTRPVPAVLMALASILDIVVIDISRTLDIALYDSTGLVVIVGLNEPYLNKSRRLLMSVLD